MALSTYVWTKQITAEPADSTAGNQAGHRLLMTITEASLINGNPFVFQKAVVTPGSSDFENAFYSVASVTDMADLAVDAPATGSVFYRTDSIDLFFSDLEALNDAIVDIEAALGGLLLANDIAITLADATISYYPPGSYERYWGTASTTTLTNSEILALEHEEGIVRTTSKIYDTDGGALYLYMIYRSALGTGAFTLGGNAVVGGMTLVTGAAISVTNANGHAAPYYVYRTTVVKTGSTLTLAVT